MRRERQRRMDHICVHMYVCVCYEYLSKLSPNCQTKLEIMANGGVQTTDLLDVWVSCTYICTYNTHEHTPHDIYTHVTLDQCISASGIGKVRDICLKKYFCLLAVLQTLPTIPIQAIYMHTYMYTRYLTKRFCHISHSPYWFASYYYFGKHLTIN